jgi:hypothetical protein
MKHALVIILSVSMITCWFLIVPSTSWASEGPGSAGASYLTLPVSAKSIAMGDVKSALPEDPFNWMSTPGAFHYMEGSGIGLFHAEWIVDTRYNNLSYYHRINKMLIISGGFVFTYRPSIQGYSEYPPVKTKELKSNNYQLLLGLGLSPVKSFTAGINLKYFREKLDEWSAGGMGIDLGALYSFDTANISFGFVVQNLGPDIKFESLKEPIPLTIRFGVSHIIASTDNNIKFTYTLDLVNPRYEGFYPSVGSELKLYESYAIRVGYCDQEYRPGSGFTMGCGLEVKDRVTLDYAWTPYGDLGSFHRLSLFFAVR